jgi:hypothetical protein
MSAQIHPEDMRCQQPRDATAIISLFAANKQIRHEALELYLSKNHFILTVADPLSRAGLDHCPLGQIPGCIEPEGLAHLRSVSMSLDTQSMRIARYDGETSTNFRLHSGSAAEVQSIADRYESISIDLLHDFRYALGSFFMSCADSCPHLRRIQLNVQNTVCILGFHRCVIVLFSDRRIKELLRLFVKRAREVESLDFLGTVNVGERQIIRSAFPKFMRKKITFHGQYNPDEGDWDAEVEVLDETPSKYGASNSSSEDTPMD